jgi:glycerophosphoryl diester phosphodiesterase
MLASIIKRSKWFLLISVLLGLLVAVWSLLRPVVGNFVGPVRTAVTNNRTNAQPYLFDLTGNYLVIPLVTVGEEMPMLTGTFGDYTPSGQNFAFSGVPDGLGVYETADAYYVYVNHELTANQSTPLSGMTSDHINGARVSVIVFDKKWQVVGGRNLIEQVLADGETYTLDLSSGDYLDSQGGVLNLVYGPNFSRFCSGYLAAEGFRDLNGEPAPIWFAPEEVGPNGRGWAVYPDGTAVVLDGLGRYAKEQVYAASQYRADDGSQTVLISTEDSADGELYLFVGQQTAADPNGFADGDLYVLRVEDSQGAIFDYETMPEGVALIGRWMPIPDAVALGSGQELSDWVNEDGGSTNFRRPEDIHEDPNQPGTFYFAATGHTASPPGGSTPDNLYGKLYRFTLNPQNPVGDMSIELALVGGPDTGVSYDNLTVNTAGEVVIQEDRAGGGGAIMAAQERYARVLAFDPGTGLVTFLFEANQAAVDPASAWDFGNWETTGVVEVGVESMTGRSIYLINIQAHSISDPNYVQGGQLVLVVPIVNRDYLPAFRSE